MQFLSKLYANLISLFYYSYTIRYSHINSKGCWEFAIGHWDYFGNNIEYVYKSKGYKC